MKKQVIRISVLESNKITAALYFLLGFTYTIIGIPMIIFGGKHLQIMGIIFLFMPLLTAVIGFICLVLLAALYNLLAKFLGGF